MKKQITEKKAKHLKVVIPKKKKKKPVDTYRKKK